MHIAVGSTNPVKLDAALLAFRSFNRDSLGLGETEETHVHGFGVHSEVRDQPMDDSEALSGARNRAYAAASCFHEANGEHPDFSVGIEGTLAFVGDRGYSFGIKGWFDRGWIVIIDKHGKMGVGSTISMIVPDKVMALVNQGKELGHALDELAGVENSKQKSGHFGMMSGERMTRTSAYSTGIVSALAPWIAPEFF